MIEELVAAKPIVIPKANLTEAGEKSPNRGLRRTDFRIRRRRHGSKTYPDSHVPVDVNPHRRVTLVGSSIGPQVHASQVWWIPGWPYSTELDDDLAIDLAVAESDRTVSATDANLGSFDGGSRAGEDVFFLSEETDDVAAEVAAIFAEAQESMDHSGYTVPSRLPRRVERKRLSRPSDDCFSFEEL